MAENKKTWYICPHCGKRILLYGSGAKSAELYIKCKNCKREIEIKLT